jgi:L-lactate dehydrogenase complex protein LldG
VKENQTEKAKAHAVPIQHAGAVDNPGKFSATLTLIGGSSIAIRSLNELQLYLSDTFPRNKNLVSGLPDIKSTSKPTARPHDLATIDVAVLKGEFAVAENGAVWITDRNMVDRALPFICENLVLVIEKQNIVPTLHEAYDLIGSSTFEYGTFIAGPSKTADIEQSLVLGAHGPKTLTVFVMEN